MELEKRAKRRRMVREAMAMCGEGLRLLAMEGVGFLKRVRGGFGVALQCSGSRREVSIAWSRGNLSPNPVWSRFQSVKIAHASVV